MDCQLEVKADTPCSGVGPPLATPGGSFQDGLERHSPTLEKLKRVGVGRWNPVQPGYSLLPIVTS